MADRSIEEIVADLTPEERQRLIARIDEMIGSIMRDVEQMGQHAVGGLSPSYRDAWQSLIEKRRHEASHLEWVKKLLMSNG